MTQLRWLPDAVRDLARLRDFLEPQNSLAAERAASRIRYAAASLMETPEIGRVVEDAPSLRDLVVHFGAGAYILRYRIDTDAVVIARVWHSREDREH